MVSSNCWTKLTFLYFHLFVFCYFETSGMISVLICMVLVRVQSGLSSGSRDDTDGISGEGEIVLQIFLVVGNAELFCQVFSNKFCNRAGEPRKSSCTTSKFVPTDYECVQHSILRSSTSVGAPFCATFARTRVKNWNDANSEPSITDPLLVSNTSKNASSATFCNASCTLLI